MMRPVILMCSLVIVIALGGCKYGAKQNGQSAEGVDFSRMEKTNSVLDAVEGIPVSASAARGPIGQPTSISPQSIQAQQGQRPLGFIAEPDPANPNQSSQKQEQSVSRKVIRNAEIRLETNSPEDAQQKIASLATKHGGYVITSEARQNQGNVQT